jgi:hypothetical protein
MKTFFTKTLVFATVITSMSSCAGTYQSISPDKMHYEVKSESNNVVLQYKHGVLGEQGQQKICKKGE